MYCCCVQYVYDHRTDSRFRTGPVPAPAHLVDLVFPHFCGIFITSTLYFMGYCVYMKGKPVVYPSICLPGESWTRGVARVLLTLPLPCLGCAVFLRPQHYRIPRIHRYVPIDVIEFFCCVPILSCVPLCVLQRLPPACCGL